MLVMLSLFDFNIIFVGALDIKIIMIEVNILLLACNDLLCILSFFLLQYIVHLVYLSGEPVGR